MVRPAYVSVESLTARLVARLQAGEVAALGELYDEHAAALTAFARRLVGDPDAAQDLVQEVFLAVPGAIRRFQGQSSLRTFLIAIAVNHSRHHVRSAARRRAATDRFGREPEPLSETPERDLERESLAAALSLALDTLPIEQRVAFGLCEVEERTSREVAAIVGAPEATVRTRLHHAKKKLRDELSRREVR
ncbi:MAG TPA: sigma-70 family RNA polymerase sigma factor [Polyangiales bacterium]|nr:sigma-70 family RNA polymerase sigma factor [Polyangiales bacterium]